ncbi:collagen-binding protein [Gemmatimonadetes bacterium T265]|nr:collagen-binding protein [Gemmatimonadetes bacterium T265]
MPHPRPRAAAALGSFALGTAALGLAATARAQTPPARPDSLRRDSARTTARLGAVRVAGVRTGVSLRNAGPVPVDRVPIAAVANVGQQEITQSLNYAVPSFYSVTQTQADGADHVDFASLRALGADQTLVLVDGKRRHTSALLHLGDNVGQGTSGVDLNSLPAAAVERVEVLRDGAAAQYGSDAIAGVMNFVLKSSTDAPRLSVQAGQTTHGDGQSVRADVYAGRPLRTTSDGRTGFVALTGEVRYREPTNRVGVWQGNVYTGNLFNFGSIGRNGEYNSVADSAADVARQRARNFNLYRVQRIGDSRLANGTLFLNSALPLGASRLLGDSAEAYAFGGLTRRQGQATAFYRFPADPAVSDTAVYPDGYLPFIDARIWDGSLAGGLRGTRGAWRYDLSADAGLNSFGFLVTHSLNPSLGDASPTSFDAGRLQYAANTTRLDLGRALFGALPNGDPRANLNLGAEWRVENYRIRAGDEASWRDYGAAAADGTPLGGGAEGFPGFEPRDATSRWRNNVGAYADLELAATERLTLDGALRAERYSDFGGKGIGKIAGLYRLPGGRAALRAAYNTGFRAPSVQQLYTSKVSTIFVDNRPVNSGFFANDDPVTRALGVAPLRPETSRNASAGLVLEPVRRLVLQVDGYQVLVHDRILASGVLERGDDTTAIARALAAYPDVQAVQFMTNAVDTRTRGVDASAAYPVIFGTNVLALSLGANYGTTRIRGPVRTPTGIGGVPLFNRQELSYIEDAYPASKYVATARWQTYGGFTALARATRFGRVTSINLFGPDEAVPAAVIADVNVGRRFGRYELSAGADNLFDKLPPLQNYDNSYFGIFNYSKVAPYGIRGRFVYVNFAARL